MRCEQDTKGSNFEPELAKILSEWLDFDINVIHEAINIYKKETGKNAEMIIIPSGIKLFGIPVMLDPDIQDIEIL